MFQGTQVWAGQAATGPAGTRHQGHFWGGLDGQLESVGIRECGTGDEPQDVSMGCYKIMRSSWTRVVGCG